MIHRAMAVTYRLGMLQGACQVLFCFAAGFSEIFTERQIGSDRR